MRQAAPIGSDTPYADRAAILGLEHEFATPEFSLEPIESCLPLAGCLAYRGFYDKAHAQAEEKPLRETGFDVDIGGVPAYSTLGWVVGSTIRCLARRCAGATRDVDRICKAYLSEALRPASVVTALGTRPYRFGSGHSRRPRISGRSDEC